MYFNAALLDRSVALDTTDYVRIAAPRVEQITTTALPAADRA
jgi:Ala-tRNA(Pro) deacylase